jgi:hypothetical protein
MDPFDHGGGSFVLVDQCSNTKWTGLTTIDPVRGDELKQKWASDEWRSRKQPEDQQDLALSWRSKLGVLPRWPGFIRISTDVVVTADLPVNEYGPDGRQGVLLCGALDDRLDLRSSDPEPQ